MKILVLNGPNINLLGLREPDIYGKQDYAALLDLISKTAQALGVTMQHLQSNCEGVLVDAIQDAYGKFDAIILNPAAYTHTSVAILDALKAVQLPAVEVHISDISEREIFRRHSYPAMYCEKTIMGQGLDGYRQAMEYLVCKYGQ